MKRRSFGFLAGTSLAASAVRPVWAQSAVPDASLLTTTLTPMGAERAGNADGSIPAWTGGLVSPPLPPEQPVAVRIFTDEQPLYTVDASNMAQYSDLLTDATKAQMTKFGLKIKVFPTHRTAAAPQYVYDNIAKNVTRAKLDPRGGRLGFTGAFGGIPFPIIDKSDPLVGGVQIIWNHLVAWPGNSAVGTFNPGIVVINGQIILVAGTRSNYMYPYYDPNGSPETYDGYYSKGHFFDLAPGAVKGQETLVWHSTNIGLNPDIVWTLLNGQGRVRKAPNEQYDAPNPESNGIASVDEASGFYGNPSQYDWSLIGKQEMLVPYNCNEMLFHTVQEDLGRHFPNPDVVRWEKHRCWVVEANLHPGEHNINAKRRFYMDEDTWAIVLGQGYDALGNMVKAYVNYLNCTPSLPGVTEQCTSTYSLTSGDYVFNGNMSYPPFVGKQYIQPIPPSVFEPQEMAANASF